MARQLLNALRDSDFAARIGGDEFVMVGTGPEISQSATQVLYELEERLALATQCDVAVAEDLLHYPGASVGVVAVHPAQTSTEQALALADAAMYENKTRRRTRSGIH